jgi:hypothetical protein
LIIITKLEAAHRQLVTAIRLYFDEGDIASIHTLACAARELYEKHLAASGSDRMFSYIEATHPDRTRKELLDILNGARNWLKHPEPSMDLSARLELTDEMNAHMLFMAAHDCALLCKGTEPEEVQAFNLWFLGTKFPPTGPPDDPQTPTVLEILATVERAYPELRAAPLAQQKRIGREMLRLAHRLLP